MTHQEFVLGLDIGTTTVKVALVDTQTHQIVRTLSRETKACMHSDLGSLGNEQDPQKILTAVQFCVSGLSKESLTRVRKVGISGQMHGVILWKKGEGWTRNSYGRFEVTTKTSPLYTWQDGRATSDFLATLPTPNSHLKLASGLGCVTLFWLARNRPDMLEAYDCAGTIQDYVIACICGYDKPVMSIHNAASWGYYDTHNKSWNLEILNSSGFPTHLLPEVVEPGAVCGHIREKWYEIPQGTEVGAALGDLQCSILSRIQHDEDAVLNISTSAQLAFQMCEGFIPPELDQTSAIEYFPYFNNRYLAVAASLTGGNVMAAFVRLLQQWTHELGLGVPESKIWERLHLLSQDTVETDLHILPTIFGERHNPAGRASVTNINVLNTTLGSVFKALCRGVITNLHSMMSQDHLLAAGIKRIVGSGTAVIRNGLLQQEIREQYKLPLDISVETNEADAAVGAALAMLKFAPQSSQ